MLSDITIGRLQSHHSVADAEGARRAQAVQQALLDGELEAALSAAGGGDEIVVLRRLQASFTLRAERSDSDNARRWGSTLAAALQRALHHAPARELLRFQRRPQALLAFVADLLQGHTQRDWAWQRLGWLPGRRGEATPGQRHQALLRLLADEPDAGVPLLRALLPTPLWPLLLGRLAPGELQGLVGSVLLQLGGDTAAHFDAWPQPAPEDMAVELSGHAIEPNTDLHHRTWQAAGSSEQRVWALRLLAMLSDPPAARQGAAAIDARVRQWMGGAPAAEAGHPAEPPPAAGAVAAGARRAGEPGPSAARPPMAGHAPPHDDAASPDTGPAPAPHTQFGGLLLLTPLLPISGALHPLEDAAVWPLASLPFALHRLALHLQAMAPHDPGALAFCGLPPGAEPPWPRQALTAAQLQALDQARTRLQAHLAERLPDWPAPRRLALLLQRQARIVADPGWIDVHFSLRDVSLDLRRAALDLDPGFIPWLGLVLRYRYE